MLWSGMRTQAQWESLSVFHNVCIISWRVHFLWPPHGAGPSCRVVMGSKTECSSVFQRVRQCGVAYCDPILEVTGHFIMFCFKAVTAHSISRRGTHRPSLSGMNVKEYEGLILCCQGKVEKAHTTLNHSYHCDLSL